MNEIYFLFTFVIEYDGGTYCCQHEATSIAQAICIHNRSVKSKNFDFTLCSDPIEVDGFQNVWCVEPIQKVEKNLAVHIIMTERDRGSCQKNLGLR